MSSQKLCVDCKWMREWHSRPVCAAPQANPDGHVLVDGQVPLASMTFCEVHRRGAAFGRYCGAEGFFWQPKEKDDDR